MILDSIPVTAYNAETNEPIGSYRSVAYAMRQLNRKGNNGATCIVDKFNKDGSRRRRRTYDGVWYYLKSDAKCD